MALQLSILSGLISGIVQSGAFAINNVAAAGAGAVSATFAAPPSVTVNSYQAIATDENGVVDPEMRDVTVSPTATTRVLKGGTAGKKYKVKVTANTTTGDVVSSLSNTLTLPIYATGTTLTNTGYLFYNPGVMQTGSTSTVAAVTTCHVQWTPPAPIKDFELILGNSSLTVPMNVSMCYATAPTALSLGSTTAGGGSSIPYNQNGLNWSQTYPLTVPVSTSPSGRGDDAWGLASFGTLPSVSEPRTDYPGALPLHVFRLQYEIGSARPIANHYANNVASGAALDDELSKENPANSQINGMMIRSFTQAVAGVTTKTAMTQAAEFRNASRPVFFIKFTYVDGTLGFLPIFVGDSRRAATQALTHSTAGAELLAVAKNSTQSRPISFVNLGHGGASPSLWKNRVNMILNAGYMFNANTAFVPTGSINGLGVANPIVNFATNADDADSIAALWAAKGARIVRMTIEGVDYIPENVAGERGSYNWGTSDVTTREGDNGVGVARTNRSNLFWEESATASAPVIAFGSLTQGNTKNSVGAWLQADKTTNESWIVWNGTGTQDVTRAHYTNNWALKYYGQYTPYLMN